MALPVTPAEMAFDAIVWMIKEAHNHAIATGETEFQVGNFMDGYFYAYIPVELNEYNNVKTRELKTLHFQIADNYIVNGQKLLEMETPVGSGSLYINFQDKPVLRYSYDYYCFYLQLPENENNKFYWLSKDNNESISTYGRYELYFGIYANIPNWTFIKHLTSNTDDDLIRSQEKYVSGTNYTDLKGLTITNIKASTNTTYPPSGLNNIYIPIDPTETYDPTSIYEPIEIFVSEWNESNPEDTINPDAIPDWNEIGQTESTEPTEPETSACGCKIDYDEILSEDELESILNQETFQLSTIETMETDIYLPETLPAQIDNLPVELVVTSNSVVDYGSQLITDVGLTPVYAPLMVFSLVCYILRGCN